jgi:hypothetical protein
MGPSVTLATAEARYIAQGEAVPVYRPIKPGMLKGVIEQAGLR